MNPKVKVGMRADQFDFNQPFHPDDATLELQATMSASRYEDEGYSREKSIAMRREDIFIDNFTKEGRERSVARAQRQTREYKAASIYPKESVWNLSHYEKIVPPRYHSMFDDSVKDGMIVPDFYTAYPEYDERLYGDEAFYDPDLQARYEAFMRGYDEHVRALRQAGKKVHPATPAPQKPLPAQAGTVPPVPKEYVYARSPKREQRVEAHEMNKLRRQSHQLTYGKPAPEPFPDSPFGPSKTKEDVPDVWERSL